MQLQLTTKEQAQALEKLGFDWDTNFVYLKNGETVYRMGLWTAGGYYPCPYVAEALKWLRKTHNIVISVRLYNPIMTEDFAYILDIYDGKQNICPESPLFRNGEYDEAESAGLDFALTYLKQLKTGE
jgi:hypothetical protein